MDEVRLARVVSVGRNAAQVAFDDESEPRVAVLPKREGRVMVVPGDRVFARLLADGKVFVESIEARTFALERRTGGGRTKTMAANIDAAAIVAAFERPLLYLEMVDELIAFCELHGLRPLLVLTKPDLVPAEFVAEIRARYAGLGYAVFVTAPKFALGVEPLREALAEHASLLVGPSGVGKSSLFMALGGSAVVGAVSERTGQGRQTTTAARLLRFARGFLIDSPGIGDFTIEPEEDAVLANAFVEFRSLLGTCRFTDCRHLQEPDCAIRAAVAAGTIAQSRYRSYCAIVTREKPRQLS